MTTKPLTKRKSDLPVSHSRVESGEASGKSIGHDRTRKPADGHPTALAGYRGTPSAKIPCLCGCGEMFTPIRSNHHYLPGHKAYTNHRCPDCQSVHRIGKKGTR